ncbi:MAG: autorepressor SdpR family transcription factor [Lachnospiraceae bacterium]|nr:autorepressor SdpR family transcription factor [Lachnospiraceae bacterium]
MGFAETFKALSDPARREILAMLKEGRKSAGEISSQFDMTAATVSYHLKQLKQAGLVYETREKNFIYYTLNTSVFEDIMMWAAQLAGSGSEKAELRKNE